MSLAPLRGRASRLRSSSFHLARGRTTRASAIRRGRRRGTTALGRFARQELRHRNRILDELAPGHDVAVKRRVGVHLNLAEPDVLHHVPVPRRVAERLAGNDVARVVRHVDIHLGKNLRRREIDQQIRIGMRVVEEVIQVHRHRVVLDDARVPDRRDLGHLEGAHLGERIRIDRVRPLQYLGEVVHVVLMRDDLGDAAGDRVAHTAGVVEVMMRHDQLRDRLVRPQLLRPGPDGRHALGVVRLDHHQVIVELDDQAVMRRAGDAPQPLGEFLRRVPGRR